MALYRFEAKVISRSGGGGKSSLNAAAYRTGGTANNGKSALSAAAYRHTCTLTDEQTGTIYDYTRKAGVKGSEILAPANAPAWAQDRQQLWNEVERVEKRKDAQLARDFVISLPHELNHEQRRAMLGEFLQQHFVEKGYLCDVAYHRPHGKGDDRNQHAHVMVPTRRLDEDGFSKRKERPEGNPIAAWKEELAGLREDWATTVNRHLEAAGRPERVSHLSLDAQGIDRAPEPKQGAIATQIEREGRESHAGNDRRRVKAENAERETIQAEISSVVSLAVEAMKRGKMDGPTDAVLDVQAEREADLLTELADADRRLQQFKSQREVEAEEVRKREAEQRDKQATEAANGGISDAGTRYGSALARFYSIKDPYTTLAQAAMAEGAAFKAEQQELRKRAAAEKDPGKRAAIELRRQIEAHEYMATTSQRLAGISATIAGRENAPLAMLDRQRAQMYQDQANKLREERAQQQQSDAQGERHSHARQVEEAQGATSGSKVSGVPDTRVAKLARIDEINKANDEHSSDGERSGGRGGR